jgi:hypothetical protein
VLKVFALVYGVLRVNRKTGKKNILSGFSTGFSGGVILIAL